MTIYETHPCSEPGPARLDLFTKGWQDSIMRDSLRLMKQAAAQLEKGQSILYINTLTQHEVIERIADRITERSPGRVCTFSVTGNQMMERLEFLVHTINEMNVKLVIVNAIEFCAIGSRQRERLVQWLRDLRDGLGMRIVVYSRNPRQYNGALGTLAWLAEYVDEIEGWQIAAATSERLIKRGSLETAERFEEELLQSDEGATKQPMAPVVMPEDALSFVKTVDILQSRSLKYNDLGAVKTHMEHAAVEEEQHELEMA